MGKSRPGGVEPGLSIDELIFDYIGNFRISSAHIYASKISS